jgi:DNA-binding XRE family transcriptional regulator
MKNRYNDCTTCGGTGKVPCGEVLRQLRVGLGMSAKQMAKRLGVSDQYISDIELNKRRATPEIRRGYGEL